MKKLIFLLSLVSIVNTGARAVNLLSFSCTSAAEHTASGIPTSPEASTTREGLQIWCSPDIYGLVSLWADRYNKDHPETGMKILPASGDRMELMMNTTGNIGFVTRSYLAPPVAEQSWLMVVGRDVIVPVMNPSNPCMEQVMKTGLSREGIKSVLSAAGNISWGEFTGTDRVRQPVRVYWYEGGSLRPCLEAFLQADPAATKAELVTGSAEMLTRIQSDPYAMGFCRLADIQDAGNNRICPGVMLAPLDVNGNGQLDYFESIYGSPEEFMHGVRIGKYPRELCGDIFCTAASRPSGKQELAFLEWVFGEGQQYLPDNGFTRLMASESYNRVQSLYAGQSNGPEITEARLPAPGLLIVLLGGCLLAVLVFAAAKLYRKRRAGMDPGLIRRPPVFEVESVLVPGGLYFDRSHTWTYMEKDGTVRIGLDDFLQHITGRITKIKMKQPSDRIRKGKPFFSVIQDGKQLEVYAPISGVIREVNERLNRDASVINRSPYMDGWVYRVEPDNWTGEIRSYYMGEKYRAWLKKEFSRLKDFISTHLNPELLENSTVVLQEGGELRDNLLENLGPLYWEIFQTAFLDTAG